MKKILFFVLVFSSLFSATVIAEKDVITFEDFEKYSIHAIYNSGEITVSYPGMDDVKLTNAFIINAPGGIYSGDEAYEGNAAENIITYAKTSDTTAIAVTGGLNNGWHGAYSHPMLYLQGGQGAESEYNASNRRLSVVQYGTGGALLLGPTKSIYVSTGSWYGYDEIDFSKPVVWESDVQFRSISKGKLELSLTKGKFSEIKPFEYASHQSGRSAITPVITFAPEGKITVFGEEVGNYSKSVAYTVSMTIDNTGETPTYSITITEKNTQNTIVQTGVKPLDFDFSGVTGVDYYAYTPKDDTQPTEAFVDNISISHLVFNGVMKSTNAVAINGKGTCLLEFSDAFDESTVNSDNIKVYDSDGKMIEGVEVLVNSTKYHRVQLKFTGINLEPSSVYKVVMKGVRSVDGIMCESETEFKSVDIVSLASVSRTDDGVTFSIKNNANYETRATIVAVGFKGGKIVSDGVYYKKVELSAAGTANDEISEITFSETPDIVRVYVIDNIQNFRALVPQKEL